MERMDNRESTAGQVTMDTQDIVVLRVKMVTLEPLGRLERTVKWVFREKEEQLELMESEEPRDHQDQAVLLEPKDFLDQKVPKEQSAILVVKVK